MQAFHSKASPLILPQSTSVRDAWLDPNNHQVDMFEHLLTPALRHNFLVQQIEKPSLYKVIGEAQQLHPYDL